MRRMRVALGIIAILLVACGAAAAAQQESRRGDEITPLKLAINELVAEAQQLKRERKPPAEAPDFNTRFDPPLAHEDVLAALARPVHDDIFIDAYVRWQLTSFDPAWIPLEDSQFAALVRSAPRLIENPRAKAETIALFENAAESRLLTPADLSRLRDLAAALDRDTELAEQFNVPALGYREWVQRKLDESRSGPQRLLWLIERCVATINAGWPPRNIKSRITRSFRTAAADATLMTYERQRIADEARTLIGLKRRAINQITFPSDNTVKVTFSNAKLDDDDVEKWIESLQIDRPR